VNDEEFKLTPMGKDFEPQVDQILDEEVMTVSAVAPPKYLVSQFIVSSVSDAD
jgi:hypothetical protein